MENYIITSDNMTDLPEEFIQQQHLNLMSLTYMIDGGTYDEEHPLSSKDFYAKMRAGSMPTTSQINPEEAKEKLAKYLQISRNIIHIAFSSGLSGTYSSVSIAARELMEEQPGCRITVVDSLCASMGEGLFVYKALELQKQGMEYDALVDWLEKYKLNVCHNFTVDDLFHLYRGGRVSKTAAVLGTMINLKPVLHVDEAGHLVAVQKVRGRKKSLSALVDAMEKQIGSWKDKNDIVFISHGDCPEDAEYVKEQVEKRLGIHQFMISPVGPTIGAHSGPGTLALFYMGDVR
ncbi:MAG: DegV family protein [Lachnospiraceae bacterium]|nr:DegV family protein [Lachnospiraceae bacterium]MDD3797120.1 DegV family protein [Lachnospiraceae bacterium]